MCFLHSCKKSHTVKIAILKFFSIYFYTNIFRMGEKVPTSEKILHYGRFQILIAYYNKSTAWFVAPFMPVFCPFVLCVVCSFSAIRFHGFLPFFEYLPFLTMANNGVFIQAVMLFPLTSMFEKSCQFCAKIRQEANGGRVKVVRKRVAAMHPFGVRLGPINQVKRSAILLCYNLIANYIFTLLITFPQEKVTH